MGCSNQGASAASASFRKMAVRKIHLQDKGHRLNGAMFLQPLSGVPILLAGDWLAFYLYYYSLPSGAGAWTG